MKIYSYSKLKFPVLLLIALFISHSYALGKIKFKDGNFNSDLDNISLLKEHNDGLETVIHGENPITQADSCSEILLLDGTIISAFILEVSSSQIKYKKCNSQYSPVYIIENTKVEKITYSDGTEDVFANEEEIKEEEIINEKPLPPQPDQIFEESLESMKKAAYNYLYESQDITYEKYVYIHFKNGKSAEGDLVREKVNKYVQIQTASGQINTYKFSDIDHIEYEINK